MDLDEMRHVWSRMSARVEVLERRALEGAIERSRRATRIATAAELVKLVVWVGMIGIAAPVLGRVPIAASSLIGYAGVAIVLGVIQLRAARLDYGAPVLALQHDLGSLARLRARYSLALGLPWWFLWIAVLVVAVAWAGGDLYATAPLWIWCNLAVSGAGLAVCVWWARRHATARTASPAMRRMIDQLSGTALARAAAELADIARFTE